MTATCGQRDFPHRKCYGTLCVATHNHRFFRRKLIETIGAFRRRLSETERMLCETDAQYDTSDAHYLRRIGGLHSDMRRSGLYPNPTNKLGYFEFLEITTVMAPPLDWHKPIDWCCHKRNYDEEENCCF